MAPPISDEAGGKRPRPGTRLVLAAHMAGMAAAALLVVGLVVLAVAVGRCLGS